MSLFVEVRERVRALLQREREEREMDAELRFHLEMAAEEKERAGLSQEEARRLAAIEFGGMERVKEEVREARGMGFLDDLGRDLRFALRGLRRQRSFTAAALATLALGIGATTAIFGVVSALLLRPLPFAEPDRLVQMYGRSALVPEGDAVNGLGEYRARSHSFEALVGYEVSARYLRDAEGSERVMAVRAEGDFFRLLGTAPLRGRGFAADDAPTVAVIGEAFWRGRLGADPEIIGRSLTLDDRQYTVVGVMPESFQFPYGAASLLPGVAAEARTDLWTLFDRPLTAGGRVMHVTGRLRDGVTIEVAERELVAISRALAEEEPERHGGRGVYLVPLAEAVVPPLVRRPLVVLFGAVGIVLLLACANLTNLSLVRSTLRAREVAIRSALGAGRSRLARQFLAESLVVSLAGGALGLLLAWWGTRRLMAAAGAHIPRAHEVGLDWRVFLFLFAACALTGAVLAVAPILMAMRRESRDALREGGGRATMGPGQRRVRDGLVVAEVALAFVLAVGATLLVRELARLRDVDLGLVSENVLTFHLGRPRDPGADGSEYYRIAERVAQVPGVRAAGFTQLLPLQNWGWTSNSTDFATSALPASAAEEYPIELRYVTPDYFRALSIPVRGRAFTADDDADAPRAIVINRALARRAFGDRDPLGLVTNRGVVVGVAGDVRQEHPDRPAQPEIYFPIAQNFSLLSELGMSLVVATRGASEGFVAPIRAAIRETAPGYAVFQVKSMERVVADSLSSFTLYLSLMAAFALLALLLAATGTYGVISYIAASRSREFAIRVSLGAGSGRVSRMVLGHGLALTAAGIAIGALVVAAASPLLRGLPITVRPPDLSVAAPVAALIAAVALAASLLPARRAAGVDPMSVLREE
jgi:putative ABC transport system permease protein